MANRNFKPGAMALEAGTIKLYGYVQTGSSGAITSQDCRGFSIAKTGSETGRYTVTLEDSYVAFRNCSISVQGTADAAYTTAKGLGYLIRGEDVANKVFYIQFVNAAQPQADAELEDSAKFFVEITLKNSSVEY